MFTFKKKLLLSNSLFLANFSFSSTDRCFKTDLWAAKTIFMWDLLIITGPSKYFDLFDFFFVLVFIKASYECVETGEGFLGMRFSVLQTPTINDKKLHFPLVNILFRYWCVKIMQIRFVVFSLEKRSWNMRWNPMIYPMAP